MALAGQAKAEYQRDYMRRKRSRRAANPKCSFCGEAWSSDRLLVGDEDAIICEQCITFAVAVIAKVRGGSYPQSRRRWRLEGPLPAGSLMNTLR